MMLCVVLEKRGKKILLKNLLWAWGFCKEDLMSTVLVRMVFEEGQQESCRKRSGRRYSCRVPVSFQLVWWGEENLS